MKEKMILFCFVVLLFLMVGCQTSNQAPQGGAIGTNERWLPQNIDDFDIIVSDLSIGGGFVMQSRGGDIYTHDDLEPIFLETPQDPLTAIVLNGADGDQSITYLLKIFYNYKETSFRIGGSDEYMTEFVFTIELGYRFDIPIYLESSLETDETVSKLTVGLFVQPNQHIMNIVDGGPEAWIPFWTNNVLNFEIDYGYEALNVLTVPEYKEVVHIVNMPLGGIYITQFFDLPDLEFEANFADYEFTDKLLLQHLQVSSGESIELAFLANLHSAITEPLTEFVIISMIDWQQVEMNNQPYLYIPTDPALPEISQFGHFFVDAPTEPGFYEFVALAVPNPNAPLSWGNYFPLEIARFTIEVTDE